MWMSPLRAYLVSGRLSVMASFDRADNRSHRSWTGTTIYQMTSAESPGRKIVLIDANGLVYRAFFALPYFTLTDGRPTNAVYGFTNMLLEILDEARTDYIAAALAKAAPPFRHQAFQAYKATRQRMP